MKPLPFDRSKHVYTNDAFVELVKDAVMFFNGTPVLSLPPPEQFLGTGVYALYHRRNGLYAKYGDLNRTSYSHPIYVGKAVQGLASGEIGGQSRCTIQGAFHETAAARKQH
jgi:hypothetical protein